MDRYYIYYYTLEAYILYILAKYNGSISAEHGLGFKKANFIHYSKSAEVVSLMKQLKNLFDPNVSDIKIFLLIIYTLFYCYRVF